MTVHQIEVRLVLGPPQAQAVLKALGLATDPVTMTIAQAPPQAPKPAYKPAYQPQAQSTPRAYSKPQQLGQIPKGDPPLYFNAEGTLDVLDWNEVVYIGKETGKFYGKSFAQLGEDSLRWLKAPMMNGKEVFMKGIAGKSKEAEVMRAKISAAVNAYDAAKNAPRIPYPEDEVEVPA